MTEFWALLALITFTATTAGLAIAAVAHLAVATDRHERAAHPGGGPRDHSPLASNAVRPATSIATWDTLPCAPIHAAKHGSG